MIRSATSAAAKVVQATAVKERYIGRELKRILPRPQSMTVVVMASTCPTRIKLQLRASLVFSPFERSVI